MYEIFNVDLNVNLRNKNPAGSETLPEVLDSRSMIE